MSSYPQHLAVDRRIYPAVWGYVACEGGSRAMTRAEMVQLSTDIAPTPAWSLGYPQADRARQSICSSPPFSGPQPVDKT